MPVESLPNQFLDLSRSSKVYFEFKDAFGEEVARAKAAEVVTQDLFSLNWENAETITPYSYSNFIVKDQPGQAKIVYEKDLELGVDVEDRLDPLFRRGMEAKQIKKMKQAVLNMPDDTTLIYPSPKRDLLKETETECCYPDSFIIAMYKKGDRILCRQFKSQHIDTKGAGQIINDLSGQEVIKDISDIDQVILGMGVVEGFLEDAEIQQKMKEVSRGVLKEDWNQVQNEVFRRCKEGGRKFVRSIESGQKDLGKVFEDLLWDTAAPYMAKTSSGTYISNGYMVSPAFQFKTSCGIVGGGGIEMGFGMNFAPISFGIETSSSTKKGKCGGCRETKDLGACGYCKSCED